MALQLCCISSNDSQQGHRGEVPGMPAEQVGAAEVGNRLRCEAAISAVLIGEKTAPAAMASLKNQLFHLRGR